MHLTNQIKETKEPDLLNVICSILQINDTAKLYSGKLLEVWWFMAF